MNVLRVSLTTLLGVLVSTALTSAQDWNQFRGPTGQGIADVSPLPLNWSETENVAWKTNTTGIGWSSPVIENNQIWITSAIGVPASEEEKKERLKTNTGNQPLSVMVRLDLRVMGIDLESGKVLLDQKILTKNDPQPTHSLNSFASPTPVIENGKLYCHFGSYGNACFDIATKKVLWTNQDLVIQHENGPGSTPIIWKNLFIFHCDGSDQQYIVALDKTTGKVAWKTDRSGEMNKNPQLKKSYGTPLIVKSASGEDQLISPASDWLYCYDPETGKELWKLNYGLLGFSMVPRPVVGLDMLFMSTSFMKAEMLGISSPSQSKAPEIVWRYKRQVPKQCSPILVGNELYFISENGIATCLDAKTGTSIWYDRIGGDFSSSPIYGDGKIYFSSRDGTITVLQPGKEFKVLAKNKLDGRIMASPAAVKGALIIRTDTAVYRINAKE